MARPAEHRPRRLENTKQINNPCVRELVFGSLSSFVIVFMSPSIQDLRNPAPQNPLKNIPAVPDCPNCGNAKVVQLLRSMRRYDRANDWFRCDKCGQLYTRERMDD